ncbi:MAG: helix-turn-helix transcriptional regulator [Methylotenera sp.]|nr:helix-turn-helix transcriptional regulator [Methylotenera sp.]
MQANCVSRIAAQVHALRKQRGLSQEQLAELAGVKQERISKIESGSFDSLTMKTLHKLAEAFDASLLIKFQSFSDGIQDVLSLSAASLKVTSRVDDLHAFTSAITNTTTVEASNVKSKSPLWFVPRTYQPAANNAVMFDEAIMPAVIASEYELRRVA